MNFTTNIEFAALMAMLLHVGTNFLGVSALMMPEEGGEHSQVFMSLATSQDIWGANDLPYVQDAQYLLANTLVKHESVTVYVSPRDVASARNGLDSAVMIRETEVDDMWMRDTSCVFAYTGCNNYTDCSIKYGPQIDHAWPNAPLGCIDFNFNGWGNKQTHENDAKVAADVAQLVGATYTKSSLVMEGGSVEVDGEGTALVTRSSVLNPNRNPGWSEAMVEEELFRALGVEKVIWTDGILGQDITDAHIDFYARFASPGIVVVARENDRALYDYDVTRQVIKDLEGAIDARGRSLDINIIDNPTFVRPEWSSGSDANDFAASYINYYVGNGVVVMQNYGDSAADASAKEVIQKLYPTRIVESIDVDPIAFGGGGIHCVTQQQPVGLLNDSSPHDNPGENIDEAGLNKPIGVRVKVTHDDYPEDTGWTLSSNGKVLMQQREGEVSKWGAVVEKSVTVDSGTLTLRVTDAGSDGICCRYGNGEIEVFVDETRIKYFHGDFGGALSVSFDVSLSEGDGSQHEGSGSSFPVMFMVAAQYDEYPTETGFWVRDVTDGKMVLRRGIGSETTPRKFFSKEITLVPGKEYILAVRDDYGDGLLDEGFVEVFALIDGRKQILAREGSGFGLGRNTRFLVPRNF